MRNAVIFSLLILVAAVDLRAELSVSQYREIMGSKDRGQIEMTRSYILGLGEGIRVANVMMIGKGRMFCPPVNLSLGVENFTDILDHAITDLTRTLGKTKVDGTDISIVLLRGLMDTFSCSEKPMK